VVACSFWAPPGPPRLRLRCPTWTHALRTCSRPNCCCTHGLHSEMIVQLIIWSPFLKANLYNNYPCTVRGILTVRPAIHLQFDIRANALVIRVVQSPNCCPYLIPKQSFQILWVPVNVFKIRNPSFARVQRWFLSVSLLYYVCYILINLPIESLYLLKNLHQNPLCSFKDLSIHKADSGKRLGFILCYDDKICLIDTYLT
jgi:hypothetical protein